jgi:hypothetical protein
MDIRAHDGNVASCPNPERGEKAFVGGSPASVQAFFNLYNLK